MCLFKFLDYLAQNSWTLSSFKTRYEVLQAKYGQVRLNQFGCTSKDITKLVDGD